MTAREIAQRARVRLAASRRLAAADGARVGGGGEGGLARLCGQAKERRLAEVVSFLGARGVRGFGDVALATLESAYDWERHRACARQRRALAAMEDGLGLF